MNTQEILRKLDEDGSTGLDMSPGDETAKAAAAEIRRLWTQARSGWEAAARALERLHNANDRESDEYRLRHAKSMLSEILEGMVSEGMPAPAPGSLEVVAASESSTFQDRMANLGHDVGSDERCKK